ncbi:MAG: hypothetical protein WBX18_25135, partial [Terracidiphilus sp.]
GLRGWVVPIAEKLAAGTARDILGFKSRNSSAALAGDVPAFACRRSTFNPGLRLSIRDVPAVSSQPIHLSPALSVLVFPF